MKRIGRAAWTVATLIASTAIAPSFAEQPSPEPPQDITIPLNPLPFDLKGTLRRPKGDGPFPAAIIVPLCGPFFSSIEQDWGAELTSWGYVTLTLDVFSYRGMVDEKTCNSFAASEVAEDVYRGLNLLIARGNVDRARIFVVGFGRGASIALAAVERDLASRAKHRFRGAAAFYPPCRDDKGTVTVSTLVVVGARDKATFEACRKMARGEDDDGISRQPGESAPIEFAPLPDAYAGFDVSAFRTPRDVRGRHYEFDKAATEQSREVLRRFLQSVGRRDSGGALMPMNVHLLVSAVPAG